MDQTFDIEIRILSCENCGAPVQAPPAGGATSCEYCGTKMIIGQRRLEPVRVAHQLHGEARIAKLRMQTGRALPQNSYSTVEPPPGCEGLVRSGQPEVIEQLAVRFREALALVRADASFDHQRLLWWCATMLNQGYGMHDKHLERRAVLERAIETIDDPGFRHMLYVNLAGAAARAGELRAARAWVDKCDPEPEDIMLDSGYRIGLVSVLVREGDARQALAVVGAKHGDVPEAHQYRMMFALYRIHAHEQLGDASAAMTAATAMRSDPEIGGLVAEALRMNNLGPKTAAALEAHVAAPTNTNAQLQASVAKLQATTNVEVEQAAPKLATAIAVIILVVLAGVAGLVVVLS